MSGYARIVVVGARVEEDDDNDLEHAQQLSSACPMSPAQLTLQ
jgi:hypothetical protein